MITGYYCTNIFSEQAKELIEFYRQVLEIPFIKTDVDDSNGPANACPMDGVSLVHKRRVRASSNFRIMIFPDPLNRAAIRTGIQVLRNELL